MELILYQYPCQFKLSSLPFPGSLPSSLSILSLSLSSCSLLSLSHPSPVSPSSSSLSLLLLSISSAVSPNSNCGWVSVGTSIFLLLPLGMLNNQLYSCCKKQKLKIKVKPHRTDFTPNQSSLAQNFFTKSKNLNKSCTPVVSWQVKAQLYADCLPTRLFIPTDFETDRP